MDGNKQYGNAMTKPLPYGCIKKGGNDPSLYEFNKILNNISREDKIGHLFIVDIKFLQEDEETLLLFNEIYTPIIRKIKCFRPINAQSFIL